MSNEQSIRDEASAYIHKKHPSWHDNGVGIVQGSHYRSGFADGAEWALTISPVIRRIQAEALREAADALDREFQDIPAWMEAYREGVRTNEWMSGGVRMVASATGVLHDRADRIEQEAGA